jgi:hypothetical protein
VLKYLLSIGIRIEFDSLNFLGPTNGQLVSLLVFVLLFFKNAQTFISSREASKMDMLLVEIEALLFE